MILGQISWLDCAVFLFFLAPQLLIHVGLFSTLYCGFKALPFLLIQLPLSFAYEHLILAKYQRSPFVQQASLFEDVVIRCVRYAFAYIPAEIGKVFFGKWVSIPFLRWRMLRHGYVRKPIHWEEIDRKDFHGVWMIKDKTKEPDIVIYYAHGGGFSMGTSYFYLEFLLAFLTLLSTNAHYNNPAILALEYTLVPEASYPTQLHQAIAGYKHLLTKIHPSRIVFSGDSAGGTIILSLLLHIGKTATRKGQGQTNGGDSQLDARSVEGILPGLAVLMSPWTTLVSPRDQNTHSDYLDVTNLHHYARQYAGSDYSVDDPSLSPGVCKDVIWWRNSSPTRGFLVMWGKEEVFAPEIREWVGLLKGCGLGVKGIEEAGGIHAWPVASLFLSSTRHERLKGLEALVGGIGERIRLGNYGASNGKKHEIF